MFERILIANRGEIAVRIMRTAKRMGIETVAVYSDADANALHVRKADTAVRIGPVTASESYLCADRIIEAALACGAQAIHPGYGFLSENADFVDAVNAAGLVFIGPSAASIRSMGLKDAAKVLMHAAGVPVVPGYHGGDQNPEALALQAQHIGYPVLIKARAGGGGKGMRLVQAPEQFREALDSASREGLASFGDAAVLIEKYITQPRHIEIQVFGDNHGNLVHLYERDCTLQRRHQKVVEEAPAPGMNEAMRTAMTQCALLAASTIDYRGAGTVEFIADGSGPLRTDGFWFMEMNTRLQVEHPVTEAVTGMDLVEWQFLVADNQPLPTTQAGLAMTGHAVEVRLYAEDAANGFLPASGTIEYLNVDPRVRLDTGVVSGDTITPYYDPMLAKLIAWAGERDTAISKMRAALQNTHVAGALSNIEFLDTLLAHESFAKGDMTTDLIEQNLQQLIPETVPDALHQLLGAYALLDLDVTNDMSGWRLFGHASHFLNMTSQQQVYPLKITIEQGGFVHLQGEQDETVDCRIQMLSCTEGTLNFVYESKRCCVQLHRWQRDTTRMVSVLLDGKTRLFEMLDPLSVTSGDFADVNALVAPMTGVVRLLDVKPGQSVSSGDRLLVLEAMKMEIGVLTPSDATVASVHCVAGDSVEGGSVLIRLDE